MKFQTIFLNLLICFICFSCSSLKKVDERPDFTLKGDQAKAEYEKFEIRSINIHKTNFASEDSFTFADTEDFLPLIENISPTSVELLEKSRTKEYLIWAVAALWVGAVIIDSDSGFNSTYWIGAGAFFGYSFYLSFERSKIKDQYNKDLKNKFDPVLGYTFNF